MKNLLSYAGKRCLFAGCFSGMGEATARIVRSLGGAIVDGAAANAMIMGSSSSTSRR